jgi:hypothetical protein
MEIIKAIEGNSFIKSKINSGKPFIASKMGGVEQNIMMSYIYGGNYANVRSMASNNAGITPPNDENLNFFSEKYGKALGNIDILGLMGINSEKEIIDKFTTDCKLSELRFLEPFYFDSPWSESLFDKRVLIIHPFEETIVNQYKKRELLFENKKVLPKFDIFTIKAVQTNGGGTKDSKPFKESYEIMENKINTIDFDIALIGCGAYGLLLASHIKDMGKQAIHIGGGLQILFGIKGKRWDVHPEISSMYNNHWVRPLDTEKTINFQIIEGGTYW